MSIVGLVLFDTLYTDHRVLVDLAEAQDAELVATRESDAELVENANPVVEMVAAVLFYGIFVGSVFYGLFTGNTLEALFCFSGRHSSPSSFSVGMA